MTIWQNY